MAFCAKILSKKLMKLHARVDMSFLFKCSLRVLRQAVSILLLSTIKISSSLASFLRDLFNTSILLLIHCWSVRTVSNDSAMAVCGDSHFASEIISLIVSVVWVGSFFVKSLVPQCIRTQSGFLLNVGLICSLISNLVAPLWALTFTLCRFLNPCSLSPFKIECPIITTSFRCVPLGSLTVDLFFFASEFLGGSFRFPFLVFFGSFCC